MNTNTKNKNNFFSKIACTAMLSACFLGTLYSQPQSHLWSIPPKQIPFTVTGPQPVQNLPVNDYTGATSGYANNVMHNLSGNPLFFIVDGSVYDKNGWFIGNVINDQSVSPCPCANSIVEGATEWLIVPVPGDCKKYYLIGADYTAGTALGGDPQPFYNTLNLSIPNGDITQTGGSINAQGDFSSQYATYLVPTDGYNPHQGSLHMAVTKYRPLTNDYLLFVSDALNIYRFIISSTGITYDNYAIVMPNSNGSGADRNEM